MFFGDHQGVTFSGRIDVHEGESVIVFIEVEARNRAGDDLAKETIWIRTHDIPPKGFTEQVRRTCSVDRLAAAFYSKVVC